ncbi:hypothetical protein FH972_010872 [Carpinus fangiana]|uniref:Uncharacterized protein n=1 Tax=Carpinus fangiana TaxID=176857 RepID=A0A660KRL1_9ROSI|nr:hypothetical protein FH972_010872 [Carpinus fangiana]
MKAESGNSEHPPRPCDQTDQMNLRGKMSHPPPTAMASTVDAYEKLLSATPEFADFGKLFKVL